MEQHPYSRRHNANRRSRAEASPAQAPIKLAEIGAIEFRAMAFLSAHCQFAELLAKWQLEIGEQRPMTRRPSLAESMRQSVQQNAPDNATDTNPNARKTARSEPQAGVRFHAATRVGKKKVTANLLPAKHKLLKSLAVEKETTTEALLSEAIDDLLGKYKAA
jgi:Antitoxin-like ribbon-helix-helix